jgi:hypothetical protein
LLIVVLVRDLEQLASLPLIGKHFSLSPVQPIQVGHGIVARKTAQLLLLAVAKCLDGAI